MKVLIIEDETAQANNLKSILSSLPYDFEVLDVIDTVVDSVLWLNSNPQPDLIFMDIHLSDGDSFKIFSHVKISSPIIFTTAYDQYALEAFKVNSIDYLLKPINEKELVRAIEKYETLTKGAQVQNEKIADIAHERELSERVFLVHFRDRIIPLKVDDILFFYTSNERVRAYTAEGDYYVDYTLETLSEELSQKNFFRANRQFIIARRAVEDVSVWSGSRLRVNMNITVPENVLVSKAKAHAFKKWLLNEKD